MDAAQQRGGPAGGSQQRAEAGSCAAMWRPWKEPSVTSHTGRQQQPSSLIESPIGDKMKLPAFQHPVKLFWPKSKCYDFLYQEAEELLKNFPVQATISFYQESDSSSEDEDTYEN
ncbi:protein ripply2.1-like [Dendropsophus ebraccatus]|uniref:protein ripply2.1-like n=1 Tax=Dendropsophus ebraccatus TaxID=150705 RepID=UPI0038316077